MIHYLEGDATNPIGDGNKFIIHNCNNVGLWGAGFTKAVSNRWVLPEIEYRRWYKKYVNEGIRALPLGGILVVPVFEAHPKVYIVNLVGQNGVYHPVLNPRPIVYDAIREGLEKVAYMLKNKHERFTIHMPKIGAGLSKGKWDRIEAIITTVLNDYEVFVYELPKE